MLCRFLEPGSNIKKKCEKAFGHVKYAVFWSSHTVSKAKIHREA